MVFNLKIVNEDNLSEMKKKYNNSLAWKCYASRLTKNPFLREYLYKKYNGRCQFCGKPLKNNYQIHHVSYDKECLHPNSIVEVPHPTPKRPNATRKVPDCANCDNIESCTSTLRPVCAICNKNIWIINPET